MSTELGLTAGLAEREDIAVYMRRARVERSKAIAQLFGFGFAVAKSAASDLVTASTEAPAGARSAGRPA